MSLKSGKSLLLDGWRSLARSIATVVLLLAMGLIPSQAEQPNPVQRPDILLIMVDSLRADVVGCYGETRPTTPAIDALAAQGVRFEKAFSSAPWTQPSVMSTFMSMSPARHGLVLPTSTVATNAPTLAEWLAASGYQTVGIVANPMAHRRYGFARGFEHYDDFTVAMDPGGDIQKAASWAAAQAPSGATVTRLAEDWLRRRDPKRPLFLFLFYMDPHWDYLPPSQYGRMFTDDPVPPLRNVHTLGKKFVPAAARERIRAAYAGEVRYTDGCIARLFKSVEALPRGSNTVIALCGDHGEAFWERSLVGHGNNLHDEEIHVPLVFRGVQKAIAGHVVAGQAGLVDLAPTLAEVAGAAIPKEWKGRSLISAMRGSALVERPLLLDTQVTGPHARGIRTAEYKVVALAPFASVSEAYDLNADPVETNNLALSGTLPLAVTALFPLLKTSVVNLSPLKGASR